CGRAGSANGYCSCSAADIERYRTRLSGPLADRIDLHVHVGAVSIRSLGADGDEEPSVAVRSRVEAARVRQRARYSKRDGVRHNADVPGRWLLSNGGLTAAARIILEQAAERLELSARGYHRALRVARTIADLDGVEDIVDSAVAEALRYRPAQAHVPAAPRA
ncbi:MAG TPA: ATP-binding protein, partial [Gemmatimonadaceae bacterium]|nr:ATP-binding protein [Gemmatimonadaceae bacterium]